MLNDELTDHRRDWNDLASLDALWAIHSRRDKKYAQWTIEEFLQTGVIEVDKLMKASDRLGLPVHRQKALDFGCGVGRLSRPLATYFDNVEGVDISEEMVAAGRKIEPKVHNLTLTLNPHPDLRIFTSESFDMVCSIIVLQHLPDPAAIERYLVDFVRVLRPDGLLAFQLPTSLPAVRLLFARRTPYVVLRRLGLPPEFLYFRLGLHPMRMTAIPERRVSNCIAEAGGRLREVVALTRNNNLYLVTR